MAVIQAATRYAFHRPGRRRPTTSRKATSRATRLSFTRYTATSPSWAMIQAAIPLSSWRPSDNPMSVLARRYLAPTPTSWGRPPTDLGRTGRPLFAEDLLPAHQQVGKAKHQAA